MHFPVFLKALTEQNEKIYPFFCPIRTCLLSHSETVEAEKGKNGRQVSLAPTARL